MKQVPADSTYQQYDIRNRDNAIRWLREHADDEKPWVLFLSFVTPHPPFFSPPETYNLYPHEQIYAAAAMARIRLGPPPDLRLHAALLQ